MGISISQDIIAQNHVSAAQRLWRHVLLNAFDDARLLQSDRKSSIYKMEAHQWIAEDTKDFQTISGIFWPGTIPKYPLVSADRKQGGGVFLRSPLLIHFVNVLRVSPRPPQHLNP